MVQHYLQIHLQSYHKAHTGQLGQVSGCLGDRLAIGLYGAVELSGIDKENPLEEGTHCQELKGHPS